MRCVVNGKCSGRLVCFGLKETGNANCCWRGHFWWFGLYWRLILITLPFALVLKVPTCRRDSSQPFVLLCLTKSLILYTSIGIRFILLGVMSNTTKKPLFPKHHHIHWKVKSFVGKGDQKKSKNSTKTPSFPKHFYTQPLKSFKLLWGKRAEKKHKTPKSKKKSKSRNQKTQKTQKKNQENPPLSLNPVHILFEKSRTFVGKEGWKKIKKGMAFSSMNRFRSIYGRSSSR